jgi:acyl-coenzyme A thioesterase PaaI-like protein
MTLMTRTTSDRHADILNGYKAGGSKFNIWAEEKLGNFALTHWEWGEIKIRWDIDDRFVMPDGVMFGGHIASVADHVAGLTAMTVLTASTERFRTSRLETNYFRPLMMPLALIEGRVTNASKSLIHVEADFYNDDDKLAVRVNAVQVRRMTG